MARAVSPAIRGGATLLLGFVGGLAFLYLSIPLPWVLGSFFATGVLSQVGLRLSLPAAWRGYAMLVIGTMLGSGFDRNVVDHAWTWLPTIVLMLALSGIFFGAAFVMLRRWGNMGTETAIFSAVPGGLSIVSAMAEDYGADVRRIALCHSARLAVLLVLAPIMIGWISDFDLADANRIAFARAEPIDPVQFAILAACAGIGWGLARVLRIPSGLLLMPLLLSAAAHISGITLAHVPMSFSIAAQLVIGCGIGTRFQGYHLTDIVRDGRISAVIGLGLGVASFAAAWIAAQITGHEVAPLLLAFLPGGAPELGVVALSLGIDPAMVAAHHFMRVVFIALALPALAAVGKR